MEATQPQANRDLRSHMQKISRLISRGLMPATDRSKLMDALKRYTERKDISRLPSESRQVLQRYFNSIETAGLGSSSSVMAIQRNIGEEFLGEAVNMHEPPMMMVLKRKGIRIFPDGRRVALYVNEKLGLTFTIPYSEEKIDNPMIGVSEEAVVENIEHLKDMTSKNEKRKLKFLDGTSMEVHPELAKKILMVHGNLNDENKAKLADMLTASKNKFMKVANFAHNNVKPTVPNA